MKYTCLKMATFGGVKYRPGDVVEAEMIQPGRARAMQDMGISARSSKWAKLKRCPSPSLRRAAW